MESIDESNENSQEKVEPIQLFEDSWFFNNLFITNNKRTPPPIIPRCFSDPCPSFSNHQPEISPLPAAAAVDKSMEEAFLAIKKLPTEGVGGRFSRPAGLTRAPSLPEESAPQRVRKSNLQRSLAAPNNNNNIARAPSLPASMMIREDIQDDESDFSMSRLIRQASLQHSDLLPPRSSSSSKQGVVGTSRSPSTPKQRQRTKPADIDNSNSSASSASGGGVSASVGGGGGGVRRQQQHQQHQYGGGRTRLARSTSDMGFQELVGLREMNYVEHKTKEDEQHQPSSSSSTKWHEQNSSASNSPTTQQRMTEQWEADKRRSVEDDMKAQIKFWARTVASNVK